ncbi:MAG: alanine--tRNA ligase [Methanomicrobiales archaeon]|nr:alanine--tRNA ligase [Methanomicrobiales archaeon]MDI6877195.1 alanine--tRNA ligase [Methanomicrobiales archaeon]
MLEEEYRLDYFRDQGLVRKVCRSCGAAFWTRNPELAICGDAPCESYRFIGNPVFAPHTLDEMREAFLSFFERHGHVRIPRYPVAARWRDDIYLTIASIADFQPYVTSGEVPPPANPLTISQPCIRLNDLDSVGRSGRHLTLFEMMAHHAFNTDEKEIYWKNETVALCDEFLASIGADLSRITYKEHPWIGGGNAGPSVEVLIGGLEVATLVFMYLGRTPTDYPPLDLGGERYYPMRTRVVDTGYGLERFVWASSGAPTVYDAVFPEIVGRLRRSSGLADRLTDREYERILSLYARHAGLMDISGEKIEVLRRRVADAAGLDLETFHALITPIERIYAIADHTRCLAYMLGDCIVPSNVREGYLARLVLRRTLRMMNEVAPEEDLADLIEVQLRKADLESFDQDLDVVREIVANEVGRYRETLARGRRIVQKVAAQYRKRDEAVPTKELMILYDSHGIPPEMVQEIAAEEGAEVNLPANFYSLIAELHSAAAAAEEDPMARYRERVAHLPPTTLLYYEQPVDMEFEAVVLDYFDGYVVLDATLFYPEGGGQPSDTGTLITADSVVRVESAIKLGNVVLHQVQGGVLQRGERVRGMIDEERRRSLMRHHTATHLLLRAAKEVLGSHIHQAGAQKGSESSRLDIRHFRHITPEELKRIEVVANQLVMADLPVYIRWEERVRAEQKFGFDLYQGGVPPGQLIRVVQVDGEVQACAGTHCRSSGEVGTIKIIRVEHVQDGVERLEFAAGTAAIYHMQRQDDLLASASAALSVQPEHLPAAAQRFFSEWKERGKEIERLRERLVELTVQQMLDRAEHIGGTPVVVRTGEEPSSMRDLVLLGTRIAESGGVALLIGVDERVNVVAASGDPRVNAAEIVRPVCEAVGGRGGGNPRLAQGSGADAGGVGRAGEMGRALIEERLHG